MRPSKEEYYLVGSIGDAVWSDKDTSHPLKKNEDGTYSITLKDIPAGKYEFLDYIRYEDGSPLKEGLLFDPAILVEESGNYLYYGFAPALPPEIVPPSSTNSPPEPI